MEQQSMSIRERCQYISRLSEYGDLLEKVYAETGNEHIGHAAYVFNAMQLCGELHYLEEDCRKGA